MLNYFTYEVCVDAINDKHGPKRGRDVVIHRDHAVLNIVHEIFRIKRTILIVVVPSQVWISTDQWSGSAIRPQHHIGQKIGYSMSKHKHGRAGGAIFPV